MTPSRLICSATMSLRILRFNLQWIVERGQARSLSDDRSRFESLTSCQHDMRCGGRRHMGGALIAQGREIEPVQEMLARPEQPWRARQVQLGDDPRFELLADGRD